MTGPTLKVTYDDNRDPELLSIDEILTWREWTPREHMAFAAVADGTLRRITTDAGDRRQFHIELAKQEERAA